MTARGRRAAAVAALLGGALIGEGMLRVVFSWRPTETRLRTNSSLSFQRRWIQEHRAWTAESEPIVRYHALLGWVNRPHLDRHDLWIDKRLTTDGRGVRPDRDLPFARHPGTARVLAIGDSFTFGDEVSDDEIWTRRLEEALPGTEVVNLGVRGYGHDQMLLLYRSLGRRYRADLVLVGFVESDLSRNLLRFRDYAKPAFELRRGELRLVGVPVPPPDRLLATDWRRPRWLDLGDLLWTHLVAASGRRAAAKLRITPPILRRLAAEIRQDGALPVLVELPFGEALRSPAAATEATAYFRRLCSPADWAACLSIAGSLRRFDGTGTALTLPGGHWTPAVHRAAAEALAQALADRPWAVAPAGALP